ncbi:MAG: hypothetical protein FWD18_10025 [Micrococcales bacterium]|nr:hypothetical protein [Micrococcales bacterium]
MAADEVDPRALRIDANNHWTPWSEQLTTIQNALDAATSHITPADWGLVPGTSKARDAWKQLRDKTVTFYGDGADVMDGVATNLRRHASIAERAEVTAQEAFSKVRREMEKS